jgi:hypothetical protein
MIRPARNFVEIMATAFVTVCERLWDKASTEIIEVEVSLRRKILIPGLFGLNFAPMLTASIKNTISPLFGMKGAWKVDVSHTTCLGHKFGARHYQNE